MAHIQTDSPAVAIMEHKNWENALISLFFPFSFPPTFRSLLFSGMPAANKVVEVMVEGIRAGTYSGGWRERISYCRNCNAKTVGAKGSANKRDRKQIVL